MQMNTPIGTTPLDIQRRALSASRWIASTGG